MARRGGVTLTPFCHFGQVFSDSWNDSEIDTHPYAHARGSMRSHGNADCPVPSHWRQRRVISGL